MMISILIRQIDKEVGVNSLINVKNGMILELRSPNWH